jgi:hypothetical protein
MNSYYNCIMQTCVCKHKKDEIHWFFSGRTNLLLTKYFSIQRFIFYSLCFRHLNLQQWCNSSFIKKDVIISCEKNNFKRHNLNVTFFSIFAIFFPSFIAHFFALHKDWTWQLHFSQTIKYDRVNFTREYPKTLNLKGFLSFFK